MPADADDRLARALARARAFDEMVYAAVADANRSAFGDSDFATHMTEIDTAVRWNVVELAETYTRSRTYPMDRLAGVVDRAIDLKLQYRFVAITLGLSNAAVFDAGFDADDPLATPRLHLTHLCIMQSLIGQIRVLWERLMTLVFFYLEKGHDPGGKSLRRVFFREIEQWSGRWDVFTEWAAVIDGYDNDYRTPEFHNRSTLRTALFGERPTDLNDLTTPLAPVMNGFWDVLTAHVDGAQNPVLRLGGSPYGWLNDCQPVIDTASTEGVDDGSS